MASKRETANTGRKVGFSPVAKVVIAIVVVYFCTLIGAGIIGATRSEDPSAIINVSNPDSETNPDISTDTSTDTDTGKDNRAKSAISNGDDTDISDDAEPDTDPGNEELPHVEKLKKEVQNFHFVPSIESSEEEIDFLARVIFREASIEVCDLKEAYYVGNVVINRVNSPDFPSTLKEVVFEPGQYESAAILYDDGNPLPVYYCIARNILNGGVRVLDDDIVFQIGEDPSDWAYVVFETAWHYYAKSMYAA